MNDEKQPNADMTKPPRRTPNREFQRMPRVIEGETLSTSAAAPAPAPGDEKLDTTSPSLATPEPVLTEPAPIEPAQIDGAKSEPFSPVPLREGIVFVEEDIRTTDHKSALTEAGAPLEPLAPPPPPPPAEARGSGLGALAAASLGSAALAALAVFGLQTMTAPAGTSPALEARIAEVERQTAATGKTQGPAPAAIAALEKRVASVEALATGAAESARKAVETAAVRPDAGQPGSAASQQTLGALGDRLARLEKSITPAPDFDGRIAAIEKTLAAPKSDERATETRVEAAPPPDLDPLRKQTAALETRLQSLERQTAPLAGQLEESRTRSEAERKRAQALADRSAGAAQIALAQSISAAVATGAPFAAQIEALGRLGVPPEKLAPLLPAAKTGVATNAELARTLAAIESRIVARAEAPADASVIDRLTNSALGLVRVRPAGETTGASPADVFARITRAVQAGDITLAVNEWDTLPDSAKAASVDWARRARERLAGESAARALLAEQAQTLGRS